MQWGLGYSDGNPGSGILSSCSSIQQRVVSNAEGDWHSDKLCLCQMTPFLVARCTENRLPLCLRGVVSQDVFIVQHVMS